YLRGVDDVSPGAGSGFHNTGLFVQDWIDLVAGPSPSPDAYAATALIYFQLEASQEIGSALHALLAQRAKSSFALVDPGRISLVGHGAGGVIAVLSEATPPDVTLRVTADLSGAVLVWDQSTFWRSYMDGAARSRANPMFFQMVSNEASTP